METAKGKTREELVSKLADRIDSFEKYSHPHAHLMAELARLLARRLGLEEADINAIKEAALLHDIGMYAMAPQYHSSPDTLSFEERMDLWRHPIIGEQQLAKRESSRHAQLLVRWHHEWWNGSGYPDELGFEDIPIGARALRAVELYSALTDDRPYRARMTDEQALAALKASAGIECDPYVIKALAGLIEDLLALAPDAESGQSSSTLELSDLSEPAGIKPVSPDITGSPQPFDQPFSPEGEATQTTTGASTSEPPFASYEAFEEKRESDAWKPTPLEPSPSSGELPGEVTPRPASFVEKLMQAAKDFDDRREPLGAWTRSRYNRKSLLGFEASVLRQIEFRTIALPFFSDRRIDWYLKAWGKHISANDPRAWASTLARAAVEAREPLGEDEIARLLEDIYVPRARLMNAGLRQWFGETDAWWMDNLRRNIEDMADEVCRAQAIMLGLQTGDYALSFNEETDDLRQPLTTVFWRLAGRAAIGHAGHPNNRSSRFPAEEFIRRARVDLLYMNLPPAHADIAGAEARAQWRECWVQGAEAESENELVNLIETPQSKHAYLAMVDRLLVAATHIRNWAIEYQEIGIASASEIAEVIKEYRAVKATYSKDVTEVAGGLRNYIIVAEKSS